MNKINIDLHGDVVIQAAQRPDTTGLSIREDNCLAYGEVTGHAHRLKGCGGARVAVYQGADREVVGFDVLGGDGAFAELSHEEHATEKFAPGFYEVRIQRTCDPFTSKEGGEWRPVQD